MSTKRRRAPAPLRPGREIAPGYTVLGHLSRNHHFDVYHVRSNDRHCTCVLKVVRPDKRDDGRSPRRLADEAKILMRLAHPNIVRAYEFVRAPEPALAVETLTGYTIAGFLEHRGRNLESRQIAMLGLHMCSALAYMHDKGFVHLDLKPANIVVQKTQATIFDFGHARRPGDGHRGAGTCVYMAPEQCTGAFAGPPADIFGLGGTLYCAATGEPPFPDSDRDSYEQLTGRAAPVRRSRRLPRPLADLIDSCLDPDPDSRPRIPEIEPVLVSCA